MQQQGANQIPDCISARTSARCDRDRSGAASDGPFRLASDGPLMGLSWPPISPYSWPLMWHLIGRFCHFDVACACGACAAACGDDRTTGAPPRGRKLAANEAAVTPKSGAARAGRPGPAEATRYRSSIARGPNRRSCMHQLNRHQIPPPYSHTINASPSRHQIAPLYSHMMIKSSPNRHQIA